MKAISRPVLGFHLGDMFTLLGVRVRRRGFDPSRFETYISIEPSPLMAELKASWPPGDIDGEDVVELKLVPPTSAPPAERTTIFGTPVL
jgi:hypothetical protein